jgi:protein involved in ribonucleotide reduction
MAFVNQQAVSTYFITMEIGDSLKVSWPFTVFTISFAGGQKRQQVLSVNNNYTTYLDETCLVIL